MFEGLADRRSESGHLYHRGECIDPLTDLYACGAGAADRPHGQDCLEIANAFDVRCEAGRCVVGACWPLEALAEPVASCSGDFHPSRDGGGCIPALRPTPI